MFGGNFINYIIMSNNHISSFTNSIQSKKHKHWMLQLFIGIEDSLNINIDGNDIEGKCIIVDSNIEHCFSTGEKICFTMLIEPTSSLALSFKSKYIDKIKGYGIIDIHNTKHIQKEYVNFVKTHDKESYLNFIKSVFKYLDITQTNYTVVDKRIHKIMQKLNECDCQDHSIKNISDMVFLSPSRLSHIFKEQTGMPLKSYILLHKIQKAYFLLLSGKYAITDAAMMAGFDSASHLAYTNKCMTGMNISGVLKNSKFLKVSNYSKV